MARHPGDERCLVGERPIWEVVPKAPVTGGRRLPERIGVLAAERHEIHESAVERRVIGTVGSHRAVSSSL